MKMKKRMAAIFVAAITSILITACGSEVVFTTGFGKNQVFQIGEDGCDTADLMVYLLSTKGQYEEVYGKQIWEAGVGEKTLEEQVKESVLEKAAQIKTMYLMAKEKELELSEDAKTMCTVAAEEYITTLDEKLAQELAITQEKVLALFEQYAMANLVYDTILQSVNPEISDDEARIVTVSHILFKTYDKDTAGNKVYFDEERKAQILAEAESVREMAVNGEQNFLDLAGRYSDDATIHYSFGKGEMDPSFEKAAFLLANNEISEVIESESGYHIILCNSTLDRERTDTNKLVMMEKRKNQVFGQEYDLFVEKLARRINEPVWQEISFAQIEGNSFPDFFQIYEKHFP